MTEMPDARSFFEAGLAEADRRVRAVGADQWSDSTPCSEWNVHELVNHLVNELRWMPPLLEGKSIADVGDSLDGDLLGSDPIGVWDSSVRDVRAALDADGVLDRQ